MYNLHYLFKNKFENISIIIHLFKKTNKFALIECFNYTKRIDPLGILNTKFGIDNYNGRLEI